MEREEKGNNGNSSTPPAQSDAVEEKKGEEGSGVPSTDGAVFAPESGEPDGTEQSPNGNNPSAEQGNRAKEGNGAPKFAKKKEGTSKGYSLNVNEVPNAKTNTLEDIDKAVREPAVESDRDYRRITDKIIDKTNQQLNEHTNAKKPLRIILLCFVIILLTSQFTVLVFVLFLNEAKSLNITDQVINVYIVSMFVETLAGLIIMIKFAFDSKQEVQLIKIMNAIVRHFKKYDEK